MPHMEGEHEPQGLRFWKGGPTVRLLKGDDELGAMHLERCEPGTVLRALAEPEQDLMIAGLLRRLWRSPSAPHPFRPLTAMTEYWSNETLGRRQLVARHRASLVREGLRLLKELPRTAPFGGAASNRSSRRQCASVGAGALLVIDPKPFVGDPAYDATQHLLNCDARLRSDPRGTICRIADLLGVDRERIRLWTFARGA